MADGLSKIAPSFRFGPVLVDSKTVRMPVPTELRGTWSWAHRIDPSTWANDPVVNATTDALLPDDPAVGSEGWLRLVLPPPGPANGGG